MPASPAREGRDLEETREMNGSYFVMVHMGSPSSEPIRSVGPFPSADAAGAWCEREELGQTPISGEWVSVVGQLPERGRGE